MGCVSIVHVSSHLGSHWHFKQRKISMGKWISMVAVAVTMLWIGLVGALALAIIHRVEPIDFLYPPLAIFLPLIISLLGVVLFLLFESGAIGWLRDKLGGARDDAEREVAESEFYQMLKEGDEWLAHYKETLSKLASKRG